MRYFSTIFRLFFPIVAILMLFTINTASYAATSSKTGGTFNERMTERINARIERNRSVWRANMQKYNKRNKVSRKKKYRKARTKRPRQVSARHNGPCAKRIHGNFNWRSSHPRLKRELCRMTKQLGPLTVTGRGNCRTTKGNRSVKGSYHLYKRGCKAADIRMARGGNRRALRYWRARHLGGSGTYRCRNFIHLDVGPVRTWHWNTRCRKRRSA